MLTNELKKKVVSDGEDPYFYLTSIIETFFFKKQKRKTNFVLKIAFFTLLIDRLNKFQEKYMENTN